MTDIFLTRPLDPSPLPRLLHSGAALLITIGGLVFAAMLISFVIGGKINARAELAARMESVETLETVLKTQQAALSAGLAMIGAPHEAWQTVLSPDSALEMLNNDADRLNAALEGFGFVVANQSEATERPLTAALSIYTISISVTGDPEAAAALFRAEGFPALPVKSFRLQNNLAAAPESVTLFFDIAQIAAGTSNGDQSGSGANE